MAYTSNVNIRRSWEESSKANSGMARWQMLYATLNPEGHLVISGQTHRTLGEPDSYVLLFDRERSVIGLRPARSAVTKNAYPVKKRGNYGGVFVRAYPFCREFGIDIPQTVRFHKCQVDNNGVLILDLNQTIPAARSRKPKAKDNEILTDNSGRRYKLDANGNKWYTY
jgi:hypothetical protein